MSKPIGSGMKPSATALGEFLRARRLKLGREKKRSAKNASGRRKRPKKQGLTQAQLARKAKITKQYVSLIELGRQNPLNSKKSDALIVRLARALQLKRSQLEAIRPMPTILKGAKKERTTPQGIFLTAERLKNDLSQAELARLMGVCKSDIAAAETGRVHRGRKFLEKFSNILNCQIPEDLVVARRARG